jgi:hypothetical protein
MGYIIEKALKPILLAKDENIIVGQIDNIPGNNNDVLKKASATLLLPKATAINGISLYFENFNDTGINKIILYLNAGHLVYDELSLFGINAGIDTSILYSINNLLCDAYLLEHYDIAIKLNHSTNEVEISIMAKMLGSKWLLNFRDYTTQSNIIGSHEINIDETPTSSYLNLQLSSKDIAFDTEVANTSFVSINAMQQHILAKLKVFLDSDYQYIVNLQDIKKALQPHVLHYLGNIGAKMPYKYDAHALISVLQKYAIENFVLSNVDFTKSPYAQIPEDTDWLIDIPPLPIGTLSPIRSSFLLQNSQRTWLYVIYDDADANITSTLFDSLALGIRVIRIKYDANASILRTRIVSALADFSTEIGVPVWDWGTGVMMAGMPAGIGFGYWNMNANINTPNPALFQFKHFIENLVWSPIVKKMYWLNMSKYYKNQWDGNGSYLTVNDLDFTGMENKQMQVKLKYENNNAFDLQIRVAIKIDGWFLGTSQWYSMPANTTGDIVHTRLMPAGFSPSNLPFSAGIGQIELIPNDPAPGNLHNAADLTFSIDDILVEEVNLGLNDCYDAYLGGVPYFEQPKTDTTQIFGENNKKILSNRPLTTTYNALLYLSDIIYDKTKHESFATIEKTYFFGDGSSTVVTVPMNQFVQQNTSTYFLMEDATYWMAEFEQCPYKITIQYKNLDRGDAGYNGTIPPATTTTAISSEIYTILIDHKPKHTNNYFRFFNALGGNDLAWLHGKLEVSNKIELEPYEQVMRGKGDYWRDFGVGADNISLQEKYKISTGWRTKTEIEWLKELLSSELIHWYTESQLLQTIRNRYNTTTIVEDYYIVVIDSDSVALHDGEHGLQQMEFEFRLAVNGMVPHKHLGNAYSKMPLVLQDANDNLKYKTI